MGWRNRPTCSLLLLLCCYSQAFNLDTRGPVVKLGGAYVDSYFGYSVAQHRTASLLSGGGQPLLLVGAPQDRNLQPGTERSGALYSCPLTSFTRDCRQVATDGRRHNSSKLYGIYDGRIPDLLPPVSGEIKEGQWLGVSLASQGEKRTGSTYSPACCIDRPTDVCFPAGSLSSTCPFYFFLTLSLLSPVFLMQNYFFCLSQGSV